MLRHALLALTLALAAVALPATGSAAEGDRPGLVRCANLTYARNKTSVCFAHHFLADVQQKTNVWTAKKFDKAKMESQELFNFPFAVISGEGAFRLTEPQQKNLRAYLTGGGFLVASPGCSSEPWRTSFRREVATIFPDLKLTKIPFDHPIFHTVYDITELKTKSKKVKAELEGLTIEGRIVLVFSPEGLNDTANAGGDCCCCGGNEVLNARQVNVNLLTYALTH